MLNRSAFLTVRSFIAVSGALAVLGLSGAVLGQPARPTQTFTTSAGPVAITPVYHAGLLIQAGGKNIYVDPTKPGDYSGLPPADLIQISHDHGDHMDPAEITALSIAGTEVMGPAAVVAKVAQAKPIANGETKTADGFSIEAVPAYNLVHLRPTGEAYHPKGVGNGYVLSYGGRRFYFSGDTEQIPETAQLKDIDVAFVCMNLPFTMDVNQAIAMVKSFHPKVVIPYHYRGFKQPDLDAFKAGLQGTGIGGAPDRLVCRGSAIGYSGGGQPSGRAGELSPRRAQAQDRTRALAGTATEACLARKQ